MQRTLTAIVAVLTLTVAACGTDADSQSGTDEPRRTSPDETEPRRTSPDETETDDSAAEPEPDDSSAAEPEPDDSSAAEPEPADSAAEPDTADSAAEPDTAGSAAEPDTPATTTAALSDPALALRAEAESEINGRLSADAPAGVTVDEIACVAAMSAAALDADRLDAAVAALGTPSASLLPAGLVTPAERDRLLDSVVGCVPWTQLVIGLMLTADTPPEVLACAQATAADNDTDRTAAEFLLFGGDLIAAYDLLPPDCLPDITGVDGVDQPTSAAGRMTVAQLASAGVSADSAACVAAQVDAIVEALDPGTDLGLESGPDIFTAMLACLTPDELALLDAPASTEG